MDAIPALIDFGLPCSVDDASRVWSASRALIVSGQAAAPPATVARATEFLARWRLHAAHSRSAGIRMSAFVATCALRLAILDAAGEELQAAAACVDVATSALAFLEAEALVPFEVPESTRAAINAVRAASHGWNVLQFTSWNKIAYAACFALTEVVAIDEVFLSTCASFDAECALRAELRLVLGSALAAKPADPRRQHALDWAARMTKGAGDDLFALGREACIWAFLTPEAERKGQGSPSAKLASWDPERGAEAHAAAGKGFLTLQESVEPLTSAMFLHVFDYATRQLVDVSFLKMFFVSDYASDTALARLETFRQERLKHPPPLVVHSLGLWYVVHRQSSQAAIERVDLYTSAADAILAWLDYVMRVRDGVLFMGKRIHLLYEAMSQPPAREEGALMTSTELLK